MAGRFSHYERPDGWSSGQPEVLVRQGVIKKLGMPVVNYDSLHRLFTDDLSVPYDRQTTIGLYGRTKYSAGLGFHIPYKRAIHVNAVLAEHRLRSKGGAMTVIKHEGAHLSHSANHPVLMGADLALRLGVVFAGFGFAQYGADRLPLPPLPESGASFTDPRFNFPVLAAVALGALVTVLDPAEFVARRREKGIVGSEHETGIVFPHSPRTELLRQAGGIPPDLLGRLGLEATAGPPGGLPGPAE